MMPEKIHSFPKVYNLGHPEVDGLFEGNAIEVTEKVDGSQFSFMVDSQGELHFRSKSAIIVQEIAPKLFAPAVMHVMSIKDRLMPYVIYRCEAFMRPKHNALAYERIPKNHLMLFGVESGYQRFEQDHNTLQLVALDLGIEAVPLIKYVDSSMDIEELDHLIDRDSILGGQKVEGIVFKNYNRFGRDGKVLMGKYVSPRFRELHASEWKKANPNRSDIIDDLAAALCSEARWEKAIARLRERGELTLSLRDIGPLMKEVQTDVHEEEQERIKQKLFDWAWKKRLSRATTAGLPDWYKRRLAERQFTGGESVEQE